MTERLSPEELRRMVEAADHKRRDLDALDLGIHTRSDVEERLQAGRDHGIVPQSEEVEFDRAQFQELAKRFGDFSRSMIADMTAAIKRLRAIERVQAALKSVFSSSPDC